MIDEKLEMKRKLLVELFQEKLEAKILNQSSVNELYKNAYIILQIQLLALNGYKCIFIISHSE